MVLPVTELRLVLLGNSWTQRASVANFILGETRLNTEEEAQGCLTVRGKLKDTDVLLINTPDLLRPNISEGKLSECFMRLSAPGPHVFLLVLQPEDFTEDHKNRLCRVLEQLSDQTYDHSLVLISTPRREESLEAMEQCVQQPHIKDLIQKCRYRSLKLKNLERPELLARLGQIVKENRGEHLSPDVYADAALTSGGKQSRGSLLAAICAAGICAAIEDTLALGSPVEPRRGALRIVLLGGSENKRQTLCNFISQKKTSPFPRCHQTKNSVKHGEWSGKPFTVVKSGDVSSLSVEKVRQEVKRCVNLCLPGPNVLLLLVKPSEFTEEDQQTLKFVLSLFGPNVFKHSMVIVTRRETPSTVTQLLTDCGGRSYNMEENNQQLLMQKMEEMVHQNRGSFLTFSDAFRPKLNLVVCGRRGAGKTSAIKAILGPTESEHISSSSETLKHQGEVGGRRLSLLELPALSAKAPEATMEESFRCVSLCEPEGLHAFILLLPVAPLTDEDKAELMIIQHTFGPTVTDFTVILFAVESHPGAPAVVDFVKGDPDIQELLQSCGGRHVVVNMTDKEWIKTMIDDMAKQTAEGSRSFTKDMFFRAQMERVVSLEAELKPKSDTESLRIVMVGKTGSGKSSSGNTILGRKLFPAKSSQTSVTRCCQKEKGEVDGRCVFVVETPDLYDTTVSNQEVNDEMIKCISLLAPGPHVFLLVMQIGRLTSEEEDKLRLIKEGFGKNSEKFTFILFTHGDKLKHDELTIDEYIARGCNDSLRKLISDCGGRYHVFDNYDEGNRTQVSDLMKKMDIMVRENGGSCYTNHMLQEAEAAIKKEVEKILKEKEAQMERERETLQRQHDEKIRELRKTMNEQKEKIKQERDLKDQQLKEMQKSIEREREERKREQEERKREKDEKQAAEERHRQDMKAQLEVLDKQIQSEKEEKKCVDRKHEEVREEMRQKQEEWEKQQREWWEKQQEQEQQRQLEEQKKMTELEEKYEQERQEYETKMQEDQLRWQQQEELKRKELQDNYEKELEALKEEKQCVDTKLEEEREEMRQKQEEWERQQREWWEEQQEQQRQQEEQKKMTTLQEKYKKERQEYETKLHEDQLRWQQHEELKRKELQDNYEKELEALKEEKQCMDRKLEESTKEMRQKQEEWEKQRRGWWEEQQEQQRQEEEQKKMTTLEEKYEKERREYETKMQEDQLRCQQEQLKRKELQDKYEKGLEALKEEKKCVDTKLEEEREEMRQKQEEWERERREWWEKQQEKEKQTRQEDQKKMTELEEKYEKERRDYETKLQEDQLRCQQEQLKRQELQDKYEKELEALKEEKKRMDGKLEESTKEMRQKQEEWEKQQREWWKTQEKQRQQEDQRKMTTLKEKYEKERQKYETKLQEDQLRCQQAQLKQKELQYNYEKELEALKEEKKCVDRKLEESAKEMRQKQEEWEKERREWWKTQQEKP